MYFVGNPIRLYHVIHSVYLVGHDHNKFAISYAFLVPLLRGGMQASTLCVECMDGLETSAILH